MKVPQPVRYDEREGLKCDGCGKEAPLENVPVLGTGGARTKVVPGWFCGALADPSAMGSVDMQRFDYCDECHGQVLKAATAVANDIKAAKVAVAAEARGV